MGWTRLENPSKPSVTDAPDDGVRFSVRKAGGRNGGERVPWVRVQIGAKAARRGSFHNTTHRCHFLIGSDEERGSVAIKLDDSTGLFEAKKQTDGSYSVAIPARAMSGKLAEQFEPFVVPACPVIGNGTGPASITAKAPDEFFAH